MALYQEPRSFYTNFVLFPSLALAATGTALDLAAAAAALVALRRPGRGRALLALGLALGAPVLGMAVIQLVLRR